MKLIWSFALLTQICARIQRSEDSIEKLVFKKEIQTLANIQYNGLLVSKAKFAIAANDANSTASELIANDNAELTPVGTSVSSTGKSTLRALFLAAPTKKTTEDATAIENTSTKSEGTGITIYNLQQQFGLF